MFKLYNIYKFIKSVFIADDDGAAYQPFYWLWLNGVSLAIEKNILLYIYICFFFYYNGFNGGILPSINIVAPYTAAYQNFVYNLCFVSNI